MIIVKVRDKDVINRAEEIKFFEGIKNRESTINQKRFPVTGYHGRAVAVLRFEGATGADEFDFHLENRSHNDNRIASNGKRQFTYRYEIHDYWDEMTSRKAKIPDRREWS